MGCGGSQATGPAETPEEMAKKNAAVLKKAIRQLERESAKL